MGVLRIILNLAAVSLSLDLGRGRESTVNAVKVVFLAIQL